MSTIRVSLAELLEKPLEVSADEHAAFDGVTDEELHRRALADPDAQPWTEDMFRRARADRARRHLFERLAAERLGATLIPSAPESDLPVWEIVDRNGQTMFLKAADIRRVASTPPGTKVLEVEVLAQAASPSAGKDQNGAPEPPEVSGERRPERQKA